MSSPEAWAKARTPADFLQHMTSTLAAGTVELPAFPQVVIKAREVLRDPNYTAQMIARVVSADQRLAAQLLNMANSTAFNATGRVIIDLAVAMTRLGAQKVYSVVLAHAIQEIRRAESLRSIARQLEDLWLDSITVAHFCDAVAKRSSLPTEDAFAAGLLHRIGHLYILVRSVQQVPGSRIVLSPDLVETWHPKIGESVLRNWQMSEKVCEAVGAQSDASAVRVGSATLTDVLIAGIRLANRSSNLHDKSALSAGGVLARLELSVEACQDLIAEAETEVRALKNILAV